MPGVTVLPNSPGLGSFGPSHSTNQNNISRTHDGMTVAEIRTKARETVLKETRGASALSLIRTARTQLQLAKDLENKGDLKGALNAYIKAASLAKLTMDSTEFTTPAERKGALRKELQDFLEKEGSDLTARTTAVEEKLKQFEKSTAVPSRAEPEAGTISKPGGSIADRLRALQDNGLSGATSKRFSRDLPNLSSPPPTSTSSRFPQPAMDPPPSLLSTMSPIPISSTSSTHTFVLPSSLGPPSPSSSPPSSPQPNSFDLTGFSQAFPSIDELDESPLFNLPSVPTGLSTSSSHSSSKDYRNGDSVMSPPALFRNFAVPIERPSSTPITPITNTFNSRPGSPTKTSIPLKPSNLSNGPAPSANGHGKSAIPAANTATPRELQSYIREHNVLLIDVRNRVDYEREHIKAGAVVCVDPTVLARDNVTAEMLEDSMVIAPKHEYGLFANRDKFDLVAVYDESSTSFSSSGSLSALIRAIYEQAFSKFLKRMPMMLVGGITAWRKDLAGAELVRGGEGQRSAAASSPQSAMTNGFSPGTTPVISPSPRMTNPFSGMNTSMVSASTSASASVAGDPHQVWTPRSRGDSSGTAPVPVSFDSRSGYHHHHYSLDQSGHSRSPAESTYPSGSPDKSLIRRPAMLRPTSNSISYTRSFGDNVTSPPIPPPPVGNPPSSPSSITYPQFPRRISPTASGSGFVSPPSSYNITSPPQASINPSQLSRRRSDFVDQSQEALSNLQSRAVPIDYPDHLLATTSQQQPILRPPPVAASSALERQDNRPRLQQQPQMGYGGSGPKPPKISSDYPVTYWSDIQIGTSGLKNLGNTCYMNAPIQCLSATVPFARFFTDGRWKGAINFTNPLGSQGRLAGAFAKLLHEMWGGDLPYLTPIEFRKSICLLKSQYNGSDQHDSQEFLSFLIDGIHEDLNRVMIKSPWAPTPEQEAELERLPPQVASDQEWRAWRARNDSLIVDFFQGQFRNRLQCLTCHKTSTTYNVFSILQLPIPHGKNGKVSIQRCLEAFFNTETLEKDDAWDCPRCKVKRRASKELSLARLPPILLIHLKRFEANGRFSDKIDTFVDFPMKSLDLTGFMPPPLPVGADQTQLNGGLPMSSEDPRIQLPPYRYDLYGVTNHYGNLTSGHYTAFVASRGGWMYCDDSSVKSVDPKMVVGQKAYVLFYKRTKA